MDTLQIDDNDKLLSIRFKNNEEDKTTEPNLEDWLNSVSTEKLIKVSYAEKYPMARKPLFSSTRDRSKIYALRIGPNKDKVIHRSWKELKQFRAELVKGFPGAFIPSLPQSRVKNAVDQFLEFIADNPYFRNDVAMEILLADREVYFHKAVKRRLKAENTKILNSIGRQRWREAMVVYEGYRSKEFSENMASFQELKAEFKMVFEFLSDLKLNIKSQMDVHESQAAVSNDLLKSFKNLLSLESHLKQLSSPSGQQLRVASTKTANALHAQTMLLCKQYGAPMLRKRLVYRIEQELSILKSWRKHVKYVEESSKQLSELEVRIANENRPKVKAVLAKRYERNVLDLAVLYQGLLGVELNTYRERRVEVLKKLVQSLADFHILGSQRTFNNWNFEGCSMVFEAILDKFDLSEHKTAKSKQLKGHLNSPEELELVYMEVKHDLVRKRSVFSRSNYLKVKAGEKLIGHRIVSGDKALYEAININGEQGLVLEEHVTVLSPVLSLEDRVPEINVDEAKTTGREEAGKVFNWNSESPVEDIVSNAMSPEISQKKSLETLVNGPIVESNVKSDILGDKDHQVVSSSLDNHIGSSTNVESNRPKFVLSDLKAARQSLVCVQKRELPEKKVFSGANDLLLQLRATLQERRNAVITPEHMDEIDIFDEPA